ncbi:hypothetical protein PtB15_8B425 [Puccinia triticina]|nr:hypothetical protein PtB15_8B425 [Puccinia triticina]
MAATRSARSAKTSSKSKKKSSTSTQAATNPKKGGVGGKANSSKKNPRICTRKNLQLDTDDEYNSSDNQEETLEEDGDYEEGEILQQEELQPPFGMDGAIDGGMDGLGENEMDLV